MVVCFSLGVDRVGRSCKFSLLVLNSGNPVKLFVGTEEKEEEEGRGYTCFHFS